MKLKNQPKKKKSYFQFRNVANGVLHYFYKLEKFLQLKHLLLIYDKAISPKKLWQQNHLNQK
jgi:hypothetical protein